MDELAHLDESKLDVIRKVEEVLDVVLIAYERGHDSHTLMEEGGRSKR